MTDLPYPDKIAFASDVTIKDDVNIVAFGDGYEQRAANGLNDQREEWTIVYNPLSKTELDAALATFKTVGAVGLLSWTSPLDGIAKKYVVVKDSRKVQKVSDKWRITLALRQVFEP